ncbi:MAG: tetratricopeptide repeat protein [Saprospiraceae bacterium]|nr:tetratricopeptide repeat protein [Saprospiraceae bacterium]MCB9318517.1 tetratricopeptide repeat protein [Lewinellaceae bacterium]
MAAEKKRPGKPKKSSERIPVMPLAWWWGIVPAIVTFILYIPAFQLGWTNWDDPRYVLENESMLQLDWGALMTQSFVGNFHPLTMLSLGIDHLLFGTSASGYHVINVVLHVLSTILVYHLFSKMSRNGWVGLFTALWFGIHPLHIESVAWIAERKDVLYGLFFIAGLVSYLHYQGSRNRMYYAATLLCFVLAVLSKAMAVVFPVALLLMDYWKYGRFKQEARDWKEKLPFFVIALAIGIVAIVVQQQAGAVSKMEALSWYNRITVGFYGLAMYPLKLLFPFHLSNVYPYPRLTSAGMLPFSYYLLALAGAGLLVVIYIQWRRRKMLMFWSFSFYTLLVLTVLQWLSVGSAVLADRYSYVSSLGIFFLMSAGTSIHMARFKNCIPWLAFLTALTVVYGAVTWTRIPVWNNSETLWRDMIRKYPNRYATAYKNLGNYMAQSGNTTEAHRLLNTGAGLDPFDAEIQESLGNVNSMEGKVDVAIRNYDEALKIDPNLISVYQNRGIAYSLRKEYKLAINDFDKALEMGSSERDVLPNRSFALLSSGKLQEAIDGFTRCIELNPKEGSFDYFISQAYFNSGNLIAARKFLNSAKQKGYTSISADYEAKLN